MYMLSIYLTIIMKMYFYFYISPNNIYEFLLRINLRY